ncbi:type II toxin-antitoxin system PemK/MazF family toxin [Sporofaciens musculi]|nr:type II toxin-antitoxin system PemK/MazF family toxin [Sporofaciens musculi]
MHIILFFSFKTSNTERAVASKSLISCAKKIPLIKTMVLLEQIRTIDKKRIRHYIGKLSEKDMEQVDRCLGISLDLKIISN